MDPYFALKALLTAQDAGLDIRGPALAWIKWLLPRQLPDGRFQRYCLDAGETWQACKAADADDALLALWLQLLYRMVPGDMPPAWIASAAKAEAQLARLYDQKLGIYAVSRRTPVGLVFWDKKHGRFRVSTQWHWRHDFYPDAVAQTYPWLLALPTPNDRQGAWTDWKRRHGEEWIERRRDPHPWGLVALTAKELGDDDTAACWMAKSTPFRYSND